MVQAHHVILVIIRVWGAVKRHIRSSLKHFTHADLQARLEEAKQLATGEVCAIAVRRATHIDAITAFIAKLRLWKTKADERKHAKLPTPEWHFRQRRTY